MDDVEEPVSFELNAPDDESECIFNPRLSTSVCSMYVQVPFVFKLFLLDVWAILLWWSLIVRVTSEADVFEKLFLFLETIDVESVVSRMFEWLFADDETLEDVLEWDILNMVGESVHDDPILLS